MALRRLWIIALVLLLAGCAVTSPKTPVQRLSYVDSQFTALVNSAADLRDAGVLTAEQAERIDPAIQRGDAALDAAWMAMGEGDNDSALSYLRVVNELMLQINAELRSAQDGNS